MNNRKMESLTTSKQVEDKRGMEPKEITQINLFDNSHFN